MTGLEFAMVDLALHRDSRWRRLKDDNEARHVYRCLTGNWRIDLTGLFYCPIPSFALEEMFEVADVERAFAVLSRTGMIEFNEISGFVRLIGWYYTQNHPNNLNKLKNRTRTYLKSNFPKDRLAARSAAEMSVRAVCQAKHLKRDFKKKREHAEEYLATLILFLQDASSQFPDLGEEFANECRRKGLAQCNALEFIVSSVDALPEFFGFSETDKDRPNHTGTLREPFQYGTETIPEHKSEIEKEIETEIKLGPGTFASKPGPLSATKNSALARKARKVNGE